MQTPVWAQGALEFRGLGFRVAAAGVSEEAVLQDIAYADDPRFKVWGLGLLGLRGCVGAPVAEELGQAAQARPRMFPGLHGWSRPLR